MEHGFKIIRAQYEKLSAKDTRTRITMFQLSEFSFRSSGCGKSVGFVQTRGGGVGGGPTTKTLNLNHPSPRQQRLNPTPKPPKPECMDKVLWRNLL